MSSPMSSMTRLDTSVTDAPTIQKAQRLMARLDVGNAELYRCALDALDWCVRQRQEGRQIASLGPANSNIRELSATYLDAASLDERLVYLDGAAFDQIVSLGSTAATPPEALRTLMSEARERATASAR
ncbi:hypothetical protein [Gemmatimonas sp.]|uniref:hypothetical protein n=1 Tax=Gemmatimonas sp. TaxID=1962908 RepID=UPI003564D058